MWKFPYPQPSFDLNDPSCTHIKLYVNGMEPLATICVWERQTVTKGPVVTSVTIPGTSDEDAVRAVYTALVK